MGQNYGHLSLRERVEIEVWLSQGHTQAWVADQLGRSRSTISREVRRNGRPTRQWPGGYDGERADRVAQRRRRWDARFKLERQPDLRDLVRQRLAMGQSPEQIAGRLAHEHGRTLISHESIYRFIYHRSAQKDYWHRLLPRKKSRRGRLGRRGGSPASLMSQRRSIRLRPAQADDRSIPGHLEADLMAFSTYGQYVLVIHERCSRHTILRRLPDKTSQTLRRHLWAALVAMPEVMRQSMTIDNGTEFALHYKLACLLKASTFFCDPHAPWQKGGIENAIGRIRRWLPRKTNLDTLSDDQLAAIQNAYNATPRKCLAYATPQEVKSKIINRVALQT